MRYKVIPPVEGGYAWWNIVDLESDVMLNFAVVTISIHVPHAETIAMALCARMNNGTSGN